MIKEKRILIFGGTGSLGKTLVRRFLGDNRIVVFSRDEAKQYSLKNEYANNARLSFAIGDIRDKERTKQVVRRWDPDIVIIAAALKQVDTCELSPLESIKTNLLGIQNVIDACDILPDAFSDRVVLLVSSDKACHPVNVYGMCKSLSERIVVEHARHAYLTRYIVVRYGNVLESRGSIIPLFKYQAQYGEKITLTHKDMTRFVMTLDQSVDLIEKAILKAKTGETWIPQLSSMKINDLASIFADKYNKPVEEVGMRPGEKIHESLINYEESFRSLPYSEQHHIIYPIYGSVCNQAPFEYTSSNTLGREDLFNYLQELGILDSSIAEHEGKSIEEIKK